jgi:glycosyltransferase involved in cell wall biosynthesis
MKSAPLISVGMPIYNGQAYLSDAIKGIQNQTYSNWELILLDDASHDNSSEIAQNFAYKDSRIRYERKDKNEGLVAARNSILALSQGNFLAWNDQDDFSYPSRLEIQSKFMFSNPNIGICGSWTHIINGDGENSRPRRRYLPRLDQEIRPTLLFTNCLSFNTVFMNKMLIDESGLKFEESAHFALDYEFWTRSSDLVKLQNIPKFLGFYRVHPSQSSSGKGGRRMAAHAWDIQSRYFRSNLGELSREQKSLHRLLSENVNYAAQTFDSNVVSTYLLCIDDKNQETNAFDLIALRRVIATRWFLYAKARVKNRPRDLSKILTAPVSRWVPDASLRYLVWLTRGTLAS